MINDLNKKTGVLLFCFPLLHEFDTDGAHAIRAEPKDVDPMNAAALCRSVCRQRKERNREAFVF